MTKAQKLDRQLALSYMSETSLLKRDLADLGQLVTRTAGTDTFTYSEWYDLREYYAAAVLANQRRETFFKTFNLNASV